MINNGEELTVIAKILGHNSVKTTEIYAITSLAKAKVATNKVVENMLMICGSNICLNEILCGILPSLSCGEEILATT